MKTFTRQQVITYILLFILLVNRILLFEVFQVVYLIVKGSGQFPAQLEVANSIFPYLNIFDISISFGLIAISIIACKDKLRDLNIDKSFIVLFLYSGFAVFLERILDFGWLTGIAWFIFFVYTTSSSNFKVNNDGWESWRMNFIIIGAFMVCFIFADKFFNFEGMGKYLPSFFLEIIPGSVYEEVIFRGLLWKFMKDLQMSEFKTIHVQAFVFWLAHAHYLISNPFNFWLFIPVLGLLLGYVVSRTKSITSSAIAHMLINVFYGSLVFVLGW